ncbi:MAG: hypothetical protein ABI878_04275 [Acidobacteriota bacterium]
MKDLLAVATIIVFLGLGCGRSSGPSVEWAKSKMIAGKEQGLSHVSGLVVDDMSAFVTIGGTVADTNEGTSGLRKIALDTGTATNVENGEKMPQSETGGMVSDDKYVYWNGGGNILRIAKDNGKPEVVASENVGIGLDMAVDGEKIYWANHGYYSPNSPSVPKPIYSVPKKGGKVEIFADQQNGPSNVSVDDKFIYWCTPSSILKQAKTGGSQPEVVFQATNAEGVDVLEQDSDNLYFGFREAGGSRWALRKISKNGGESQTLVKTFSLKPFVIDDQNIYFFDEDGMMADAVCKIAKSGGDVVKIDTGYSSGVITQTKKKVFFGSLDTVYSIDK